MTLSKLSPAWIALNLVTLLSLMSLSSPPALSLETGYDCYPTDGNPTTDGRYRDLKCAYLFAGITHLRLVKLILEDKTTPAKIPVGLVEVNYNIRAVICTLYDVTHVEIGSLWLLLLYASTVPSYYERFLFHSANEANTMASIDRLIVIHEYVIGRMQRELSAAGCRPGNKFDSYEKRYARQAANSPSGVPNSKGIRKEVLNNCKELDKLLKANSAQSAYGKRYEALKSRQLFINNLGVNRSVKPKLMTRYDVQVTWEGTSKLLKTDYVNAQILYSPTNGLYSVKQYYRRVFSLFKVIVYRLTWKFVLYVNTFAVKRRENHLKKWHDLLTDIQTLLCLQDDPDIKALMGAIKKQGSVDISNQLDVYLHTINDYLQCVATDQLIVNSEDLPSSALQSTSEQAAIDWNSVKDAQDFIADLTLHFRMVNFCLIRSMVNYIDDETKW